MTYGLETYGKASIVQRISQLVQKRNGYVTIVTTKKVKDWQTNA